MPTPRRLRYVNVNALPSAPRNPKRHEIEGIKASIRRFGWTVPVLVDDRAGKLVAGHGRRDAAQEMRSAGEPPPDGVIVDDDGFWLVPVVEGWLSGSDDDARDAVLGDNRLTELGGYDLDLLALTMGETTDWAATGWTERDLLDLQLVTGDVDLDNVEHHPPGDLEGWPVRLRVPSDLVPRWQAMWTGAGDDMIIVSDVHYVSMCEHHLAPAFGVAHVAYVPDQWVVGYSKLKKGLNYVARGPQLNERILVDTLNIIEDQVQPLGVGLVLQSVHCCMAVRANGPAQEIVTVTGFRGVLRDDPYRRDFWSSTLARKPLYLGQ